MRGKWEGTYRVLPGGRVRVQISVHNVRHSHTAPSMRAARQWVTEMRRQAEYGHQPERARVSDAFDAYLQHLRMSGASSTLRRATGITNTYREMIGNMQIARLTPSRLNALFAERLERGYAASTIMQERRVLLASIQRLVREGTIVRNPVSLTSTLRVNRRDYTDLVSRAYAGVDALRSRPEWIAYAMLLSTGLRVGELHGLKWSDLEALPGGGVALRIERSDTGRLKTATSRRVVTIGKDLGSILIAGRGYPDQPVIRWSRAHIGRTWQLAGTGLRLHDLRHAHASEMLASGVPITAVSRRLGHASVTITLGIYAHQVDTLDLRVAEVVEQISRRLA